MTVMNGSIYAASYGVYRIDGDEWVLLGEGIDGYVQTLLARNDSLFAGGSFTSAGGAAVSGLAVLVGGRSNNTIVVNDADKLEVRLDKHTTMEARVVGRQMELIEGRDARVRRVRPMTDATGGVTVSLLAEGIHLMPVNDPGLSQPSSSSVSQ